MTEEGAIEQRGGRPKKGTDEQFNRLGTEKIGKLLREFAIPAIASLVVNGLYNILSAIFLGWGVGELGLAVSTVANPMMMFFMALGMLVGTGGNALCAIKLGEGRKDEAERVLGNTVTIGIIVYLITLVIIFLAIDPVLAVSGATDETWEWSRTFLQILGAGSIVQIIGFGINNFIRSAGDPNRALWTMLAGTITCLALSFLFVIVLGWGIVGQAVATIMGQGVSAFLVLYYFIKSPKSPFKLKLKNMMFKSRMPLTILALGSASFLMQLAASVVSFIVNNQVVIYGAMSSVGETGCFAVFAVIQRVAMFVMFPVMGITIAAQPLLGYCYGARIPKRVKATLKMELQIGVIMCVIMWLLIEIFAGAICTAFGITDQLLDFCVVALRFQTIVMPCMAFQIVISSYFQATGRPIWSIFLSLTRQIIYLIPIYIFAPIFIGAFMPDIEQIFGVLAGPPVADVFSFITAIIFIILEFRRLNRAIRLEEQGLDSGFGPKFGQGPKGRAGKAPADGASAEGQDASTEAAGELAEASAPDVPDAPGDGQDASTEAAGEPAGDSSPDAPDAPAADEVAESSPAVEARS